MESEEEEYWHKVMLDRCNAQAASEEKSRTVRAENTRKMVKTLHEQMEMKKTRECAAKEVTNGGMKILPSRDTLEEKRIQLEKNRKLREGLAAQLKESKLALEKRQKEEEALKEMSWSLGKVVDPSSPEYRRDKEARRREILSYMESMQEFRDALARREAELDECLCLWAKDLDEKKRLALQTTRENRRRADRELKLAWDLQLEDKRNRQKQELEPGFDPAVVAANEASRRAERLDRHRAAKEYGRELLSQHEERKARRIRELQDVEEGYKLQVAKQELQEREFAKEVRELGSRLRISGIP